MKPLIAYTENGKWGYRDRETHEILIPARYDDISPSAEELSEGYLRVAYDDVQVKLNDKWGVRSVTDEEILPVLYDGIESHRDVFFVKINDKCGIVDAKGKTVTPIIYDEINCGCSSMIRVRQNDKWGVLDKGGREILPVVFDDIDDNILAPCFEITFRGKKGIVTYDGGIIVPPDCEDVYTFKYYHPFGVKKDGKWQIVDRKNRPKNVHFYDRLEGLGGMFESTTIAVSRDNKWGLIYTNGQEAYPICIEDIKDSNPFLHIKFLHIKINDKWGVLRLDWKVEEVVPIRYDSIEEEKLGLDIQEVNGKFGVVDHAGNTIIPTIYDTVDDLRCKYAKKFIGKKEGASDDIYIPPQYIEVSKGFKRGIFDVFGNEKVPVMYDMFCINYNYNDLIPACLNGKWGYINRDNEVIIPFIYDYADYFGEQFAEVAMGDKFGFIDRKGNLIRPLEYDSIVTLGCGLFRVGQNGKVFEIEMDSTGKIIEQYDMDALVNIATWLKEKELI